MSTMLLNYGFRQFHRTLNGLNPSSGFRDMYSAKWCQICQVFGPWESPYGANGQMTDFRSRQFQRTSNKKNPPSGFRDMHSAKIWQPPDRPTAPTVAIIAHQPEGLRGKISTHMFYMVNNMNAVALATTGDRLLISDQSLPVSEPAIPW